VVGSAYSNDYPGSNGCFKHDLGQSQFRVGTPDLETVGLVAVHVYPRYPNHTYSLQYIPRGLGLVRGNVPTRTP